MAFISGPVLCGALINVFLIFARIFGKIIWEVSGLRIDEGLISYLEELSCLSLSEDEKRRLTSELEKILGYMARLSELDTAGVEERSHPFDDVNAFREDIVTPSIRLGTLTAPKTFG